MRGRNNGRLRMQKKRLGFPGRFLFPGRRYGGSDKEEKTTCT